MMPRILCLSLLWLCGIAQGWAQDGWTVLIEPKFYGREVTFEIPGAKSTVFVAARIVNGEPQPATRAEFVAAGATRESVMASARAQASAHFAKLTPEYSRDRHRVIEYAKITSDDPLTATTILAPEFLKKFTDTLGPRLLVAIPNRFTIFVFPRLVSDYRDYTAAIIGLYQDATWPTSLEVFEVGPDGIRAIGAYTEP